MTAPEARRVVSRVEVLALSLNDVVGSGVYLLPAAAAAALAGSASLWGVALAGLAVLLIVLCFAEAASLDWLRTRDLTRAEISTLLVRVFLGLLQSFLGP